MKARPYLPLLLAAVLAAPAGRAAEAPPPPAPDAPAEPVEAESTATGTSIIKFSDPSKPGTLKLSVMQGDIQITGGSGAEVVVKSEVEPEANAPRPDGLRVLSASSSYSLSEKNNVATLKYGTAGGFGSPGDFNVTVPQNTNIVISSSLGGDIEVRGVSGNLEIKSLNGEVHLSDVSGGALVETMNGEIKVDVRQLSDGKPLSFSSMNGEVEIRMPVDAKANVRLRTHNGSILTDFDEKQLVTKTASLNAAPGHPGAAGNNEIANAVREAARMSADVAREAARAAREAVREHRRNHADGNVDVDVDVNLGDPMPPMPPLPPMTGGKIVTGTLNGGGTEVRVTTMNGNVTLRKFDASKS